MKFTRLLLPLLFLSFTACSTAPHAASALKPNEQQLLGLWEDYTTDTICVEFFDNHTMKIHLAEEQGRNNDGKHYIEAKWSMDDKNHMTYSFEVGGESVSKSGQVSFENGELWMTWSSGNVTKNRRVKELPARFKW